MCIGRYLDILGCGWKDFDEMKCKFVLYVFGKRRFDPAQIRKGRKNSVSAACITFGNIVNLKKSIALLK
jgi:hypothetical protein